MNIKLVPLQEHEKETFIRNIQIAFKKAVVEQFGPFDEEIIPRDHVIRSFEAEGAESYTIVLDGEVVGGTVLAIHPDTKRNELQLLFVNVDCHSKGVGFAAWQAIEALHPEKKTVYGMAQLKGVWYDEGFMIDEAYLATVGSSLEIYTKYASCTITITSITPKQ